MRASSRTERAALFVLVCLIVVSGTLAGFLIGRRTARDKVSALLAAEHSTITLAQVLPEGIDDPLTASALAKLYDLRAGDRDALLARLHRVAWGPPYRPAPFVGHMARPRLGGEPRINLLGFRDARHSYVTKPDRTVRIFLTGGSTAWGSGASSDATTLGARLEHLLNERVSRPSGQRYEVVNAAFPAWSTTQEKMLIQQRLVDLHPDVIVMFSGNNDVHWTKDGRDIRWSYTYVDQNYLAVLNELYRNSGHPEWTVAVPFASRPIECSTVGRIAARNVEDAALAAGRVEAQLIFALQPNVLSTAKRLSPRERRLAAKLDPARWTACYQALRDHLGRIRAPNYRFLDLSRLFGELDEQTELFVDSYHVADLGNRLMAQGLADSIDWRSINANAAVTDHDVEPLRIITVDPVAAEVGKPFDPQPDRTWTLRVVPNRINHNLLIVFDQVVLPTVIGEGSIAAAVAPSLYAVRGDHTVAVADGMTGETSPSVVFRSR